MIEEWKPINEFEGYYEVSNLGRVKSCQRVIHRKTTSITVNERILKLRNNKGYMSVCLRKNKKSYWKQVHRLVAEAFIPNPNNYPIVNHKDENPSRNIVTNLEWCTKSYNNSYNGARVRAAIPRRMEVLQFTLDGVLIKEWSHTREAAETLGLSKGAIYQACKGKIKTSGGFIWKRKKDVVDKQLNI